MNKTVMPRETTVYGSNSKNAKLELAPFKYLPARK